MQIIINEKKLPSFASVKNLHVPPFFSCHNSMETRLICLVRTTLHEINSSALWTMCLKRSNCEFPCKLIQVKFAVRTQRHLQDNTGFLLIAPSKTGNLYSVEVLFPQNYFSVCRPYIIRALQ